MDGRFLLNIFPPSKWAKVQINLDRGPSHPNIEVDLACEKVGGGWWWAVGGTEHTHRSNGQAVSIKANSSRLLQGGHLVVLLTQTNQWLKPQRTIK